MTQKNTNFFTQAIKKCRRAFIMVFIFSLAANLLTLLTPLYSLQVLDRVISSWSRETLVMLSLVMIIIYTSLSLIQVARSFTLIKIGEWLDKHISPVLLSYSIAATAAGRGGNANQNLRDLGAVKDFLTSIGINTLFDLPWTIVYIIVIFFIHPYLGVLTVVGAMLLSLFAFLNAYATNDTLARSTDATIKGHQQAEIATRNAETVEAMGMMKAVIHNWRYYTSYALDQQSVASYRNGIISNMSKFVRMVLQMLVTGIGAYLVIKNTQEMTVGGMIASSILVGKALAPFDSAIEIWKRISSSKKSYERIIANTKEDILRQDSMHLPEPKGYLVVENVFFTPANTNLDENTTKQRYTLQGVSFRLEPGEVLVVLGPSAAGKSTLAKLLVGIWKPSSGNVRLDGADIYSWNRENFGKYAGYLPQGVELFNGTVKDNIARLQPEPDPNLVAEAAQMAGAHELILNLANGYETDIGMSGSFLSGGQRQRVGLARAFFGNPKFIVLDEPNANLDEKGEKALADAVQRAKEKQITMVIISHRPSILNCADKVLILHNGAVAAFGSPDEIFARTVDKPVEPNNNIEKSKKDNE